MGATLPNAIRWLITLEILNLRREKIGPNANQIVNNVKKVLLRLASKNLRVPILLEFKTEQVQIYLIFSDPLKTPSPAVTK